MDSWNRWLVGAIPEYRRGGTARMAQLRSLKKTSKAIRLSLHFKEKLGYYMSVTLASKLDSIPNHQIAPEINAMLDKASVSIAWTGKRIVHVEGYRGQVELGVLFRKYLQNPLFDRDPSTSAPLADVMECYWVCKRIQELYEGSDKVLSNTLLYKYFIPSLESRPCLSGGGRELRAVNDLCWTINIVIEFTPKEFRELWPDRPLLPITREPNFARCMATKKMLKDLVRSVLL
jgi:hypothetical protein